MATVDFSGRDTIVDKGVGTAPTEVEFTAYTKTALFTTSFKGTIEDVVVSGTATTPGSGLTNPCRLSAKVYTTVGGTETSKVYPLAVWHSGQTSTTKNFSMVIPINKRIVTQGTVTVALEFIATNAGAGLSNFGACANIGYTSA